MSENKIGTMDTLIQSRIDGDTEFQDSIKDLSDEEKTSSIESRRAEILKTEAPKWFEEANKNKEIAENQRKRAEKAEIERKSLENSKNENGLSQKDVITLSKSDIHEDDIEDVIEYAKFKGVSVSEALKSGVMKATLAEKTENRRTAAATQTRSTRQTVKIDGQAIIQQAKEKGEAGMPEPGSSEAEELFWARRGGRREQK